MLRVNRVNGCLCLLSAVGSFAPFGASATDSADAEQLEEIVVTAQKRTQSINDVGMTIQAASGDSLERLQVQGPEDLAKLVPGFTFTKSIYSTPVFTLRGIGLYDATFGATPPVAVYTDQIPRDFPVMSQALDLDIERVEVLKGPQGTLFGQSSTGGAVNYITAKPTTDLAAGIGLSYERFDREEMSAFISGPISDTLRARLAVKAIQGGAWQYSESRRNDELGDTRKLMARLTVDWKPVDPLSIESSFTAVRDRSDPQAPQYAGTVFDVYSAAALAAANADPATRNPYGTINDALYSGLTTPGSPNYDATFLGRQGTLVSRMNDPANAAAAAGARALLGTVDPKGNARAAEWTAGLLGPAENSYFQGTLRVDWKLTDIFTITSVSAYAHQKLQYAQDLDGTVAQGVDVPLFGTVRAFNQELRFSADTDRLHWIAGAGYDDSTSDQSNFYHLLDYSGNAPIPGLAPISLTLNQFESTLKSYAGFTNIDFNINSNLSVTAGGRYTKNEQTASYCYNDPPSDPGQSTAAVFSVFQDLFTGRSLPPIQPGQCFPLGDGKSGTTFGVPTLTPLKRSLDQDNTSYRVGLNYKFDQGTLAYVSVSQGYKAGLFSAIGASSTSQYAPAVQEKVVAYEAGFKAPLLNHRVNFNGAAFFYDYTDKQVRGRVLDAVYGLLEKMINVPKSHVWGLEGELQARPVSGLSLSASATYLKSEVTSHFSETPDGSAVYNAAGYTGDMKGSALPFTPKFSANGDVEYELPLSGSWAPFAGANVTYQGGENTTFANGVLQASDFEIPSYATVDVRAGVRSTDGRWQVSLYGRNVFDKYYITSITTYLDTRIRFAGQPAIYGVAARINF